MPFAIGHDSGNCVYILQTYKKCNLMYIGNTPSKPNLILNDVSLAVVDEVKDLGVVVDCRLKFEHS